MTPRDFSYWLQGYFELRGIDESEWQSDRIQSLVRAHLDLVKATPGNYLEEMTRFMGWMESCLEFRGTATQVSKKLNEIFEHVIDPATPGDPVEQNQAHSGTYFVNEPGVRC